ncbi:MAG: zinc metallopeptidase [Terrisporobacter othiniensis]|uniref:Zinc metallopeptidase n=2 Tax=Terrisporobacter hibernicus TaxID=2813371 RepID=A0AAX2ZKI1_9FIRM|nr:MULTISPECIES: zinc metallopeptidase [Terrisporobacter]MBN9646541.1 zinc metallopeptidase [Terrisporobacter glycolicus]MDU4859522.1 zinc metallopeptidase [Terrisporobacter othiniensis]MDU6993909.1 zinc metallopeptidase [Terrisporobacter othiniensis]UEL49818.1 zinc metallopeptidase [Terrisporobacter hibernicus]UPA32428.1 zinc metallopeptidase [Terrisporobacter glycolicus]
MYGYYGYGYDPTMFLLIPAILLTLYAQYKVNSTTNRFFNVRGNRGYTGEDTARKILDSNGLYNVRIEMVRGRLSDHYDPRSKVLRLSQDVYSGTSITSVAVAAHECGHAIQHAHGYAPLNIRSSLVPVVNFASSMSWIFIMLGFFTRGIFLQIGILLFSASVLFQIVTLPVEFNASSRALTQLTSLGIVDDREVTQSRKVLQAAALTYVAAAVTAILQLLRLLMIANNRDD